MPLIVIAIIVIAVAGVGTAVIVPAVVDGDDEPTPVVAPVEPGVVETDSTQAAPIDHGYDLDAEPISPIELGSDQAANDDPAAIDGSLDALLRDARKSNREPGAERTGGAVGALDKIR